MGLLEETQTTCCGVSVIQLTSVCRKQWTRRSWMTPETKICGFVPPHIVVDEVMFAPQDQHWAVKQIWHSSQTSLLQLCHWSCEAHWVIHLKNHCKKSSYNLINTFISASKTLLTDFLLLSDFSWFGPVCFGTSQGDLNPVSPWSAPMTSSQFCSALPSSSAPLLP